MKSGTPFLPELKSTKLLDQGRERIRYLHYSLRTEESYVYRVRAFIRFHGIRHPATMGGAEVEAFLSWLASDRKVSASTHKQALSALLFLYGKVLGVDLPWMGHIGRTRTQRRLPVVLYAVIDPVMPAWRNPDVSGGLEVTASPLGETDEAKPA